ncbi:ABC1 kinase family protein [Adlercreutzia agrestimuris]|uniref:ABC1 kinase family protein n=1 Tax=Adlercreutzia agrestimuris TaxID=2941324 RepID=UPI00203E3418|nr:AarF/UbiB family protein [Adlercreutzia agrestimuris]
MPTIKEFVQFARESRQDKGTESRKRLHEIEHIVRKYHVFSGLTPEKATHLLEDLGPTFVKMGQIAANRSDIIPQAYADAFKQLRADVPPMPFETVEATLNASLGHPWTETFDVLEPTPLGSASIAQVHKARIAENPRGPRNAKGEYAPISEDILVPGMWVAVKVRRPNVAEKMLSDLALIRHVVALVGLTNTTDGIKLSLMDLVDELERTTKQEINFCVELENLVKFRRLLADQPGIECPRPFPVISSDDVLVMEYVQGPMINDLEAIRAEGLDPAQLGHTLAESYVTQVVENGFFHADPHAGNILVRDGTIVWIDLGMVGTLNASERGTIMRMMHAAAENDAFAVMEALLACSTTHGEVDHGRLLEQLANLLTLYSTINLADIDVGAVLTQILELLRTQNMSLPPAFTLLARSMVAVEGVLVEVAPQESIVKIISHHVRSHDLNLETIEAKARELTIAALSSAESLTRLPTQASHTLQMLNRGQISVGADLEIPANALAALYSVSGTIAMALISAGLFVGSSMLCTTNMAPKLLGVPVLGVLGYIGAFVLGAYVVWRNIVIRHRQKNDERL